MYKTDDPESIKVSTDEPVSILAEEPETILAEEPESIFTDEPETILAEEPVSLSAGKPKSSRYDGRKNLIPINKRPLEEQKEIRLKGGYASGEKRKKNKTFKEALEWYLDMEVNPTNKSEEELLARYPGLTNRDYVAISAVGAAAQDKDVRAMVFARDTVGEMPKQTVGIEQEKPFEITIKTVE